MLGGMFTLGGGETIMEGLIFFFFKKKRFENALGYSKTLLIMLWVFTPPNKKIGHKTIFNYRLRKG